MSHSALYVAHLGWERLNVSSPRDERKLRTCKPAHTCNSKNFAQNIGSWRRCPHVRLSSHRPTACCSGRGLRRRLEPRNWKESAPCFQMLESASKGELNPGPLRSVGRKVLRPTPSIWD